MIFVDLTVTLLYSGKKAQKVAEADSQSGINILFKDLPRFKLPYPKRDNITFVSDGTGLFGYEFSWPSVQKSGVSGLGFHDMLNHDTNSSVTATAQDFDDTCNTYGSRTYCIPPETPQRSVNVRIPHIIWKGVGCVNIECRYELVLPCLFRNCTSAAS
jgi:hypothetical protein